MTFGEKLQKLRARAGLSQDQLAELLDVSRQAVSKWERNEAMPEAEKLVRISRQFGVSTDYLLLEEQETPARKTTRRSLGAWFQSRGWLLGVLVALYGLWRLLELVSGTWEDVMDQVDGHTFWEGLEAYLFHYKRGAKIAADLGWIAAGVTAAVGGAHIAGQIRWYHVGAVLAAGGAASALTVLLCCASMLCLGLPTSHALEFYGGDVLYGAGLALAGFDILLLGRRYDRKHLSAKIE